MKQKYIPVVKELCLKHMQSFHKSVYEKRIAAEMKELLPDMDNKTLNSAALCVSNALNSKVRAQMGLKKNRSCASSENCAHCEPGRKTNDENDSNQCPGTVGRKYI